MWKDVNTASQHPHYYKTNYWKFWTYFAFNNKLAWIIPKFYKFNVQIDFSFRLSPYILLSRIIKTLEPFNHFVIIIRKSIKWSG